MVTTSNANGINDAGQVVGWSDATTSSPYIDHAFRYTGGTMEDLGSSHREGWHQ